MLVYDHHIMEKKQKVMVVAGPTSSGKSDFAVELAKKCNGEIISADSRQIYKGLDIGTGKITEEEMGGIPHHMLDIAHIGSDFSVVEYKKLAQPILLDILSHGKIPIICGGTGQYIDSLIYDIDLPEVEPNQALRDELEKKSASELYAELEEKDLERAEAIDPHNKVRLIRALEIVHALGSVPKGKEPELLYDVEFYLMSPSRDVLKERIARRVEKRLSLGMIDEVKHLIDQGYTADEMKRFGLEYEMIGRYLEGTCTEEEMKEKLIRKSFRYAKRQETWNKKYLPFANLVEVR
jgi:tRNA dimethylallyltransferase